MKLTKLKEAANVVTMFASEHRTSLMIGGGIAGMVVAGVTAVRVTPVSYTHLTLPTIYSV